MVSSIAFLASAVLASRNCFTPVKPIDLAQEEAIKQRMARESSAPFEAIVPTYVNIISGKKKCNWWQPNCSSTEGVVTKEQVEETMSFVNAVYNPHGIKFVLKNVTFIDDNDAYSNIGQINLQTGAENPAWEPFAKKTRRGGSDSLNLYSVSLSNSFLGSLLGVAWFPQWYKEAPHLDSIRLAPGTWIGGSINRFNLGKTLVHEIGHWLGLYHTFQGFDSQGNPVADGCTGVGDEVSDTPAVKQANAGCPKYGSVDSCPNLSGKDDVTNFMDYTDDACSDHFTPGQIARIRASWDEFRRV